ncbi:DNA helicase [Tanacetum coccineum]
MEFHNFPQPTRPYSFSKLTSFKYSASIIEPLEPIVLQDNEPSTSTSYQQQEDAHEDEVFNELTRILFECLENVDNEHKGLLLRKIFSELEKESDIEKFLVKELKHTQVKVISEFIERYPVSSQDHIGEDDVCDQQETEYREIKDDYMETNEMGGSIAKFSRKLERFKVKTLNIEGGGLSTVVWPQLPGVCKKPNVGHFEYHQSHVASQVLPAVTSSLINDSGTHPLRHPDVCVHHDTNLDSVATYALAHDYEQRTSTKGGAADTLDITQESHTCAPDAGYICTTTSPVVTAATNSSNNIDFIWSNSCIHRYLNLRTKPNQQRNHNSREPRLANSIPLEYIHMGRCTCVCRHCGAMFWECEKMSVPDLVGCPRITNAATGVSMTSLGANIDSSINNGKGPYVFRISGQIYHWIGSMCPDEGNAPRFLQLYIYDTTNEVSNRMSHFGGEHNSGLKREIVEGLIELLDNHNALVQLFRTARNKQNEANVPEFKVKLYNVVGTRHYELPTAETVGAIVFGGTSLMETEFDLIVEEHSRIPQRVNKLHPCYMSLQFPLIFIYGEEGYHKDMKLINVPGHSGSTSKRMSMNMYYGYQIHDRLNHYNLLPRAGKLFQQYVVTAYCAIEQNRLDYIRQNQNDIRNEYLSGLYDAIMRGDCDGTDLGTRTVLTASFTGGPRYMYAHYLDALAICRVHGNPSFFITFTCNAKWPEIKEYMEAFPELTTADRADIVDRVFEQKVRDYVKFIRNTKPFGDISAVLYTIEFQKRGLPHCHSLLWVSPTSKVREDSDVDKYISAELPNPAEDPDGYRIISELMMHGPCGSAIKNASCMKDGNKCNRNFPKPYSDKTYIDKDGFVHYRRRETGIDTERQNVRLDNSYVVPYNRTLCTRYYAHINVEYCGWTMLIKYLFKYISKGTDRVVANITRPIGEPISATNVQSIRIDEIKNFVEARYIGPHEACWRMLEFPIHYRDPAVLTLAVHLENMQQIRFRSKDRLQSIRILLCHQKGCTSFRDIRKVHNIVYPTNRAACEALGLIGGDQEWIGALEEAALHASSEQLRKLFVQILIFCDVSDPILLWHKFWENMSEDIPRRLAKILQIPEIEKNETEMKAGVLFEIESLLNSNSKTLKDFGLPMPPRRLLDILQNRTLMEERNYNRELLLIEKDSLLPKLNDEQKQIFDEVVNAISNHEQKLIFVYGHGGTGKTFLWKALAYVLRLEERIVLAVASSGIASLLLPSGRTAHSRFKIPLNLHEECICSIKKNSQLADLLRECDLIIWEEAPMNDRRCFEALDRCLKDILDNPYALFGGKSIILGGDFRQTLPVKKKASKAEIIDASITSSYLWPVFKVYTLRQNMRLSRPRMSEAEKQCIQRFLSWLLDIGDGNIGVPDETDSQNSSTVYIPEDLCILDNDNAIHQLINFTYNDQTFQTPVAEDLQKKAIVFPKNEIADTINAHVLSLLNHERRVYLSSDEATPHGNDGGATELLYPTEYLNTLKTMTETNKPVPQAVDKGKMTMFKAKIIILQDIRLQRHSTRW